MLNPKTIIAILGFGLFAVTAWGADVVDAPFQITPVTKCSRLTKPGTYGFKDITARGHGACLVIDGPKILVLNGTGGGGGARIQSNGSGVGILFTKRATGSELRVAAGEMGVAGFDIGILIEANGVQLPVLYANNLVIDDSRIGIELLDARGVTIGCPTCDSIVRDGAFDINTSGIGVLITGNSVNDTITGTVNQPRLKIPPIGIEVDRGPSHITVFSNSTEGAMIDMHPHCGTDTWRNDTFVFANRSCIH